MKGGENGSLTLYNGCVTMEVCHENRSFMVVINDADKLTVDVCDFITEVEKENGQDYPPASLYDLVASLSGYVECERPGLEVKLIR